MKEKISKRLESFGLKVTEVKRVGTCTFRVEYKEGTNDFYTKSFDLSPKGEYVSEHNGKLVVPLEFIGDGEHAGRLIEKESAFLFEPLPIELIIPNEDGEERICYLEYVNVR